MLNPKLKLGAHVPCAAQVCKAQALAKLGGAYRDAAAALVAEVLRGDPEHEGALLEYVIIILERGLIRNATRILLRLLVKSHGNAFVRCVAPCALKLLFARHDLERNGSEAGRSVFLCPAKSALLCMHGACGWCHCRRTCRQQMFTSLPAGAYLPGVCEGNAYPVAVIGMQLLATCAGTCLGAACASQAWWSWWRPRWGPRLGRRARSHSLLPSAATTAQCRSRYVCSGMLLPLPVLMLIQSLVSSQIVASRRTGCTCVGCGAGNYLQMAV